MLKIKDEKWQEFCDKAEEFGFISEKKDEFVKYQNKEYGNRLYVEKTQIISYDEGMLVEDYEPLDTIYDLITQGFVEKI